MFLQSTTCNYSNTKNNYTNTQKKINKQNTMEKIISNWRDATTEECNLVKAEIYKLVPEWKDERIASLPIPNNQFILFPRFFESDKQLGQVKSVLFDMNTKEFTISEYDEYHYIPRAVQVFYTFVGKSLFEHEIKIVFCKCTGLFVVETCKQNVHYNLFFKDEQDMKACIDSVLENNNNYQIIGNEIGKDIFNSIHVN